MAVRKNSSEEDYLDNLLNAVLNNSNEKKQEELNNEEDLLGEIEEDLFDGDISSMEALDFEQTEAEAAVKEEPVKEKKGFFGRRKKSGKRAAERSKSDKNKEAEKEQGSDAIFDEALKLEAEGLGDFEDKGTEGQSFDDLEKESLGYEQPEHENFDNPHEFMETLLGDDVPEEDIHDNAADDMSYGEQTFTEENTVFEEEDMKGLYDILGVDDGEEGSDLDEISRLEEEKPKKKSRKEKKAKRAKKKFGKKKDKKDELEDMSETLTDLDMNFADNAAGDEALAENTDTDLAGGGFAMNSGMEDMGLGGFDDIFMGGDETESQSMYSNSAQNSEDYGDDLMYDDEEEEEPKKKDKKDKKDKKKKEKKKKEKKEKKPKKEKPKKEKKKSVKPKEPDEIIHISIPFIIFSVSVIVLIVVGLKLGGNYRYYKEKTDSALTYYLDKNFDAAYYELAGLEMNDDDVNFYNQVETVMYVQRHYTAYKNLYELGEYDQALFTLLRGVKMYDKYKDTAREYNCYDDMTLVLGWIDAALEEKYGLTESEARELNLITDRYEYAERIYELADKAEAAEKALEEEE